MMFLPILDLRGRIRLHLRRPRRRSRAVGAGSHLSFPPTWGGEKRAGVEFEKRTEDRRGHPRQSGADIVAARESVLRERRRSPPRLGPRRTRSSRERSASARQPATSTCRSKDGRSMSSQRGVDAVFDTRIDPMLARNAVYGRAAWEHLAFGDGRRRRRGPSSKGAATSGCSVRACWCFAACAQDSNVPLPPYLRPLLGGIANLRGFRRAPRSATRSSAASAELRLPLSSPLSDRQVRRQRVHRSRRPSTTKGSGSRDQHFERGYRRRRLVLGDVSAAQCCTSRTASAVRRESTSELQYCSRRDDRDRHELAEESRRRHRRPGGAPPHLSVLPIRRRPSAATRRAVSRRGTT